MGVFGDIRRKHRDEGLTSLSESVWRNALRRTTVGDLTELALGEGIVEKLVMAPRVGYWPRVREPRSFNEKIMHRKHFSDGPRYATVSDKYAVRSFVQDRVGRDVLNELYHVCENPSEIAFEGLPSEYVVKPGNKTVILADEDGPSRDEIRGRCEDALSESYGTDKGEWWYGDANSRILIEKRLHGLTQDIPLDYKFFVFDGRVECIQVDHGRFSEHTRRLYDREWTPLDVALEYPLAPVIDQPSLLDEMIDIAGELGDGFDFVRVDLYETVEQGVVFGEMTLAPEGGGGRFSPREFDFVLGSKW